MRRATIATLALCAAMLFPNWAAAHVVSRGDAPLLGNDEYDQLTRETLPIVHDCPQVAATFRAQDMTEKEFDAECNTMDKLYDFFHAKMRTDPASNSPLYSGNGTVEILAFSSAENMHEYYLAVYGRRRTFLGLYSYSGQILTHRLPLDCKCTGPGEIGLIPHEYTHHLDHRFLGFSGGFSSVRNEGLAVYIPSEFYDDKITNDRHLRYTISQLGINGNLPRLFDDDDVLTRTASRNHRYASNIYSWGDTMMHYLFDEQPQAVFAMNGVGRTTTPQQYINEVLTPLTGDFHRWLRAFIPLTLEPIGPVTIFDDGRHGGDWPAIIDLANYFRTVQELTYTVSLSIPYEVDDSNVWDWLYSEIVVVAVDSDHGKLYLQHGSALGTVEVTVTATTRDGERAGQTFTVTVVEALQSKAITSRDAVSTEEGETAINLADYYTGPALSDVEFTVASNKPDVARVAVRDGRLVITAVAVGEADITLRSIYHGRETTQTFTVTITDDCPSYLCLGFFNGWRWLLLEDGQAVATETTETE